MTIATKPRQALRLRGRSFLALVLAPEPPLDEYYRDNVVGGPNSFLIVATEAPAFPRAILQKLLREIADAGGPPAEYVSAGGSGPPAAERALVAER